MSPGRRALSITLVWLVGAGVLRATLWAPEVCPPLSAARARVQAVAAGNWIVANQELSGLYEYEFDRNRQTSSGDYNLVRHAGVTMSLYQLARAGEIVFLGPADLGLAWMLDRLQTIPAADATGRTGAFGPGMAFTETSRAKLGASSLLLVSLAQRRLATSDHQHDDLMIGLGRFIVGQQRPDGSMLNFYDLGNQAPVPDLTSIFATGEALWGLALLHEAFPTLGFDVPARLTLDYMATERDIDENFFPRPWPDQWASYSLAEMVEWGLDDHHIDYARALMERYSTIIRFDAQRGTTIGSLTHGPAARGAGFGTWIEGLASLHTVALADGRLADAVEPLAETIACGAARLAERQVEPGPGVPDTEAGAWFFDNATRMDDQQHAASGLVLAEAVLP